MHSTALSKSAAAITLAALAVFGVTACSSGGSGDSNAANGSADAKSSGSSTPGASGAPSEKSTPKAGIATKVQCVELQAKLNDSEKGLEDAAGKFDADFGTLVTTLSALINDENTQNAADAQTQLAQMQTQETAIQADATGLEKVCG
jgi:hypothetical protein